MAKDELPFRHDLKRYLENRLGDFLKGRRPKLKIEEGVKILYDITALKDEQNMFHPRMGFLDQDIVIYEPTRVKGDIKKYFYKASDREHINFPRAILEVKYGRVNSHDLITYSQIAARVRGVFNETRYYLFVRFTDKETETLLRHGTGFDAIIVLEKPKSGKAPRYRAGAFQRDLDKDPKLSQRFEAFVRRLKAQLSESRIMLPNDQTGR